MLNSGKIGFGGILADAMGLGKTLTMLTAILCSKQLKDPYPSYTTSGSGKREPKRSNSTLVVLPSRRKLARLHYVLTSANNVKEILDVWKNEIDQYVYPANTARVDATNNIQALPAADVPGSDFPRPGASQKCKPSY